MRHVHEVPILLLGEPIAIEDVQPGNVQLFATAKSSEAGSMSFWHPKTSEGPSDAGNGGLLGRAKIPVVNEPNPRDLGGEVPTDAKSPQGDGKFEKFLNISNLADSSFNEGIIPNPVVVTESEEAPASLSNPTNLSSPAGQITDSSDSSNQAPPHGPTKSPFAHTVSIEEDSQEEIREMFWKGKLVTFPMSLFAKIQPTVEGALRESVQEDLSQLNAAAKVVFKASTSNARGESFRTRSLLRRPVPKAASSLLLAPPGFDEGPSKRLKRSRSAGKMKSTRPFMKHLSTTIKKTTSDGVDGRKKKQALIRKIEQADAQDILLKQALMRIDQAESGEGSYSG